jgi:hypothetical protein
MNHLRTRYKADWYDKKIEQNKVIQDDLISIINKYKEPNFPWSEDMLRYLENENLLEIAIPTVNKGISVVLGEGMDFDNHGDAKLSIARFHSGGSSYASGIKCKYKEFILAYVYEPIQKKSYYFAFPKKYNEHTIPFDKNTGAPKRNNYMWDYECSTFEEMANYNIGLGLVEQIPKNTFDNFFFV